VKNSAEADSRKKIGMTNIAIFSVKDIRSCFKRVPESFKTCFSCGKPAVNIVCGNLEGQKDLSNMRYGKSRIEEMIAHSLLERTQTSIALPTCEEHTMGEPSDRRRCSGRSHSAS
jgi:hypothetical protein